MRKPFGLWEHHPSGADYGLIPRGADGAKPRFVALNNRVVAGLLIEQRRRVRAPCSAQDRFRGLVTQCFAGGDPSSEPFGVDPAFVSSSSLFDPTLRIADFYSDAEIGPRGLPFGFFPSAPEADGVFPVFIDVNADEARARAILQMLVDGFFVDGAQRRSSLPPI